MYTHICTHAYKQKQALSHIRSKQLQWESLQNTSYTRTHCDTHTCRPTCPPNLMYKHNTYLNTHPPDTNTLHTKSLLVILIYRQLIPYKHNYHHRRTYMYVLKGAPQWKIEIFHQDHHLDKSDQISRPRHKDHELNWKDYLSLHRGKTESELPDHNFSPLKFVNMGERPDHRHNVEYSFTFN